MINQQKTIYANLGVKTLINAQGTYTALGWLDHATRGDAGDGAGVRMVRPHRGAARKSRAQVDRRAAQGAGSDGDRGAQASAITVGTAACMTRDNSAAIEKLPETGGVKDEVVIQEESQVRLRASDASAERPSSSGLRRSRSCGKQSTRARRCSSS